ncbi:MAG: amidohydrolase [Anaerolineales bacterium]
MNRVKLLHNAHIHTLDSARPSASAIAIQNGLILAVGETPAMLAEFERAEKQDMQGCVILPGLTDSHLHLEQYALSLQKVDCETSSLEECLRRIAARVHSTPAGEWILGHGWNQNDWGGWPALRDLDAIAPHHPVYLTAKSLHAAWANSAALHLAGIRANSPDPANGRIQRDPHGQPTGILLETAMELVNAVIPAPSLPTITQAIEQAQTSLWSMGLTGLHDFDRRNCFIALQRLHQQGKLRLRVLKSIPLEDLPAAAALGLHSGFGDDWLRIGPVKVFMDGALGPRTAAMFQPYEGEPDNRGILKMDAESLFEIGRQAAEAGFNLAVHAIGDRANHEVLNAYAQLRRFELSRGLPPLRQRIEHLQVIYPNDAGRLAELGVIASMQPIHAPSDMRMADRYWGQRAALAYAWRTQLEKDARLTFGSDAPVESPNPFWGLHAALTRQRSDGTPGPNGWYPQQRLTMQEALSAYTLGPAYTASLEDRAGKLAAGHLADLIVLEQDPFRVPPSDLLDMHPRATMVGGHWVWQA